MSATVNLTPQMIDQITVLKSEVAKRASEAVMNRIIVGQLKRPTA